MDYPVFDAYFDYVRDTEPPLIFHRWSLLPGIGALLGRNVYLPFGDFRIFPNMYVMLIGNPGTRKSTAIKLSRKALSECGYLTFAGDKTSKEKFLVDLAGESQGTTESLVMETLCGTGCSGDPREVYVVADEFNEFMGTGNLEFISLLGSLWDWDDESRPFEQKFKNSQSLQIYQPTISLLGGNTHSSFAACFPPATIGQGFMSRLILVHSEPSGRKIAFPTKPSDQCKDNLRESLDKMRAELHGEMQMSRQAREMLTVLYNSFTGLPDIRFQHYSNRRFTHLLKLCMISAAARCSMTVDKDDVIMANTLLSFAEHTMPAALGEFGKARNSDVSDKIIALLTEREDPCPEAEIWTHVRQDLDDVNGLQKLLQGLIQANKIQWVNTDNSKLRGYMVVRQVLKTQSLYVDYSLLPEAPDFIRN